MGSATQTPMESYLEDIQDPECNCVQCRLNRMESIISKLTEKLSRLQEAENDS